MRRFAVVANRRFVLEEMLAQNCNIISVGIIAGSHLDSTQHSLDLEDLDVRVISSHQELQNWLNNVKPDTVLSNGCPYILNQSILRQYECINIHPSVLPDLRGIDPVIGSILFQRPLGATCHWMDEGVDTGDIIAQVSIPVTDDIDVRDAYQMSFLAECQVFSLALDRDFRAERSQSMTGTEIYFSRRPSDFRISFTEDPRHIVAKSKAFANKRCGCLFRCSDKLYKFYEAKIISNPYICSHVSSHPELHVAMSFEDIIIFRLGSTILRFSGIKCVDGVEASITIGMLLSAC